MNEKIPFIKRKDLVIILIVLLVGIIGLLAPVLINKGGKCTIALDGQVVYEAYLSAEEDGVFTLAQAPNFEFEIKNNQIRILHSPCHDKICVNTGFIGRQGQSIVCLPYKLVVKIEADGTESGADLIIG